ncbi:MAG: hypothetical protein M3Y09_04920 [Actinomycetota bacterium]|nr:hypothetical protein [Actinomycetota bacterium]
MPSLRKKAKAAVPFTAADVANITRNNPYIQRLIEDSDLRDSVRAALDSGKSAYGRLSNGKAPHRALLEDKKLQNDLRQAAEAVRDATLSLSDAPKRRTRKKRRLGRTLLIALVGAAASLAGSEKLRGKVLDTLFGAEEEFQYTPPASTPAPPPATPVTAA